jgi:hypothetical protein
VDYLKTLKRKKMGLIYANIELINGEDLVLAKKHYIGEDEVKRMWVSMRVDTGSVYLCINENIQEQLQLPFKEKRKGQLAVACHFKKLNK